MFERLSKKLDDISRRMLLGQIAKKRARQLRENNAALSANEAVQIAAAEALSSLRAERIDVTSYSEVSAWSKRYLAPTSQPQMRCEQNRDEVLKNCDFTMAADEIRDMLKMTEEAGVARGEQTYYKPELLEALYPFIESPSLATAIQLLEVAPFLWPYFEKCSPGGDFYEMRRLLDGC